MADPRMVGHAIRRRMGAESSHLGMAQPKQMNLLDEGDLPSPDERQIGLAGVAQARRALLASDRKATPSHALTDDEMRDHLFFDHGLSANSYRDRGADERTHHLDHRPGWSGGPRDHNHGG